MKKIAVIFHGWPQKITRSHSLYKFFDGNSYKVCEPYLFSKNFVLGSDEVNKEVEKELGGNAPNVIVGVSIGGLLAPNLALKYPEARLVLIATGSHLDPESEGFRLLVNFSKNKLLLKILNIFRFFPEPFLLFFYQKINSFKGNKEEQKVYEEDMRRNIRQIINIPLSEDIEVIDFVLKVNNNGISNSIHNKTIIFAGENDLLMPAKLSRKMAGLIKQSKLVMSKGGHFNAIDDNGIAILKEFLR